MRLPFDVDRLMSRPVIYDERGWRNTPDLRISRDIDPFLDIIAMETANELADKADTNLLRTFHYNMMSSNGFRNRDFERLVQFVSEFIDMLYVTRRIRMPDQGLLENIADAVALHSCKQVLDFPELEEICARSSDSRMMQALDTNVGRYQQLVRDLDQLHSADQRDVRGAPSSGGRGDFRSQYAGGSPSSGYRGNDRYGYRDAPRNISGRDAGGEYAVEPRTFRRDEMYATDRPTQRRIMESSRTFIDRQEQNPSPYVFVPQPIGRDNDSFARGNYSTRPSEYEAAPPAPPPPEMSPPPSPPAPVEKTAEVQSGRCMEPIPAFKGIIGSFPILNEKTMDMQEHSRVYDANEGLQTKIKEEVIRTMSLAQAVTDQTTDKESIKDHIVTLEDVPVYTNLESLVNYVSDEATHEIIRASGENLSGERKIIHTFGIVDNSISGFPQLSDIRALLSQASSLKEVVRSLRRVNEIAAGVPREAAVGTDLRATAAVYDRILTREVNAYFRNVLKLSDGNAISSITDDFDDLLAQVQASGNNELINAMLVFFTQLNGNLRESLLPEFEVVEGVKTIIGEEESKIGFCVMPMSYAVTFVPFTAAELGIDVTTSKAIMATSGDGFLRSALDITSLQAMGKLENSIRLMITRDRQVMRVNVYPGRNDVIILSAY